MTAEMLLINFTLFFFFKEVKSEKKKRELRKTGMGGLWSRNFMMQWQIAR